MIHPPHTSRLTCACNQVLGFGRVSFWGRDFVAWPTEVFYSNPIGEKEGAVVISTRGWRHEISVGGGGEWRVGTALPLSVFLLSILLISYWWVGAGLMRYKFSAIQANDWRLGLGYQTPFRLQFCIRGEKRRKTPSTFLGVWNDRSRYRICACWNSRNKRGNDRSGQGLIEWQRWQKVQNYDSWRIGGKAELKMKSRFVIKVWGDQARLQNFGRVFLVGSTAELVTYSQSPSRQLVRMTVYLKGISQRESSCCGTAIDKCPLRLSVHTPVRYNIFSCRCLWIVFYVWKRTKIRTGWRRSHMEGVGRHLRRMWPSLIEKAERKILFSF